MYESLICEWCGTLWSRERTRGRKPRTCRECRYYAELPVETPHRRFDNITLTDGGKRESGIVDKNDCTVKAIALACDVSYEEAYQFMQKNGRKPGKGAAFELIIQRHDFKIFGRTLIYTPIYRSKGIPMLITRNPWIQEGTWILHMTRHVAVLKDGKLFDSFDSSRKMINRAWKVS